MYQFSIITESLEHFLVANFSCTKDEASVVASSFKYVKATKNEVLVDDGRVCRYLYFIIKGGAKAYFIDNKGLETIRYVAFENEFIASIYSFIKQIPADEYICALEPCELLAISYSEFKTILSKSSLLKDLYIKMLEETYLYNHWRIETLLRLDAKKRYEYMLLKNRQLVQRLSNKNLSSYLGITQESLSRIKGKK